jgi:hypothetical protein
MAGEAISLDELRTIQERSGSLSTIEVIADQDDRVKVTPFAPGVGSLHSSAITVPQDAIGSLTTTDEVHYCRGKTLMVVEVSFADPTLDDVYRQIRSAAVRTAHARHGAHAAFPGRRPGPWHEGRHELARLSSWCDEEYEHCTDICARLYHPGSVRYRRCVRGCHEAYIDCISPPSPHAAAGR